MLEKMGHIWEAVKICIYVLLTAVFFAFIPLLLGYGFDSIVEYDTSISKYMPDFLLIIFSICLSTSICLYEYKGSLGTHTKAIIIIFLLIFAGACLVTYCFLFSDYTSASIVEMLSEKRDLLTTMIFIGILFVVTNYLVATIIKILSQKSEKKQDDLMKLQESKLKQINDIVNGKTELNECETKQIVDILAEV